MKSNILKALLCLFLLAHYSLAWAQNSPESKIVLQLQWKHQFEFAGFYAAIQQGFYAQRGLQVELREYQEGMDIVDEVLSGRAQYAVYHSGIVRSRLEGKPVKLLANYFKRLPLVILTSPEISTLADLRGKRLMASAKDQGSPLMKLAFEKEGLQAGKNIEILPHTFSVDPLIRGEVDGMTAFVTNEPFYLEQQGVGFNIIDLSKYMRSMGDGYLFSSDAQTRQYPRQTQDLIEATNEGWRYALAHQEEIVDLIVAEYSQRKSREALLYEADKTHDIVLPLPLPVGAVYKPLIDEIAALIMHQEGIEDKGYLESFLFVPEQNAWRQNIFLSNEERDYLASHTFNRALANGWIPFNFTNEDGKGVGITEDYWRLMRDKLGLKETISKAKPFVELLDLMQQGQTDIIPSTTRTEDRETYAIFSNSFEQYPIAIATRKNTGFISSASSLEGQIVAVGKGYTAYHLLKARYPGIEFLQVKDTQDALKRVADGGAYAAVDILPVLQYQLEYFASENVKFAGVTDVQFPLQVMVHKQHARLVPLINRAIAAITPQERVAIHQKWMVRNIVTATNYKLLWQIFGMALLIIGIILYWNRRLAREISERKKVEVQLRKLSQAVEHSHSTIVITDLDAAMEYVNPAFTHATGYTQQEAIGQNPRILQSGYQSKTFYRDMWDTLIQDGVWQGELCNKRKDGGLYWEFATISSVKGSNGKTSHYVAVKENVTERKHAEDSLRASEEKLRALYELSPLGIALTDMQGRYIEFNDTFVKISGYAAEELKVLDYWTLTPPEYEPQEVIQLEALLQTGRYGPYEKEYRKKDGSRVPLRLNGILITGVDGQSYIWSLVEDITGQKQHEAALRHAKETAEIANRAKSAFLANMSHEIRTPMNAIIGMSGLVLGTQLSDRQHNLTTKVHQSAEALMGILNDILDLSKIEANQIRLEATDFHLKWELDGIFNLLRQLAPEKQLDLHLNVAADVPLILRGDPLRLRQILLNLGSNAIKFTHEGTVTIGVELMRKQDQRIQLRFQVADTGIGINPEEKSRLFHPFSQADDSISRQFGGTGLGLTISKSLVELMDGDIGLESKPGKGTLFHFSVWLEEGDAARLNLPEDTTSNINAHIASLSGARVMLVEDNELNQELVMELLSRNGIEVMLAENGQQALELLETAGEFDGILMDIQMPVMDGYQATSAIRSQKRFADLPIIAMTACVMATELDRASAVGMSDHIGKPININEMFRVMAHWITPGEQETERAEVHQETANIPVALDSLVEINWQQGLATTQHNVELYRRLLGLFRNGQRDFATAFHAAQQDADPQAAIRIAHTLKGTAGNIGANKVQKAAEKLEAVIRAEQSNSEIEVVLQEVVMALEPVLNSLGQVLVDTAPLPVAENEQARINGLIEELKNLLQNDDPDALDQTHALTAAMPEKNLQALNKAVAAFDFATALAELERASSELLNHKPRDI